MEPAAAAQAGTPAGRRSGGGQRQYVAPAGRCAARAQRAAARPTPAESYAAARRLNADASGGGGGGGGSCRGDECIFATAGASSAAQRSRGGGSEAFCVAITAALRGGGDDADGDTRRAAEHSSAAAALIEAYGAAGESDGGGVPAGMKLLLSLADTDVRLTRRHFHALLASLAGSPASAWRPQAMDWAWSLLAVMRQQSCAPNVATYSLLLSVAAPAADGRAKRFHISNVLKQLSADGLRPSGDTAAALFAACDSGELWDAVVSFLREGGAAAGGHSVQRSWLDDAAVAAGRCERVEAALDLARRHSMSARGYNALLLQLAAAGRSAAGWALLRDMQKRYLRPSSRACCAVLQAFADDGATAEQLAGVFAALPWHAAAARKYVNLVAAAGHHNYDRPSHDYDSVGLQPALPPSLLLSVADGSPSSAGSTSAGLQKLWAQLYFLSLRCGDFGATQSLMGRAEARRLWPNAATAAAVLAGCSRASQLPLAFSIISWAIVRGSLSAADVQRPLRRALLRLAEPTADSRFVLLSEQLSELMAVADDGTGRLPARALVDEIVFLAVSGGSGGADGGITDEAAVHVHWARLAEYAAITLTEWPPPEASALPTGWAAERERQEREGRS
eukprot:PLAT6773.1.p1 GENE.PLAT6773.1~~PLAT6773.1.p1  ORF type:complete len:622 (+),score=233.16 PLAT6773.1:180-2045(+)